MGGGGSKVGKSKDEKELAKISAEQWNDYQLRFVPQENRFIADVTNPDTPLIERMKGKTNADAAQAFVPAMNPNAGGALSVQPFNSASRKVTSATTEGMLGVKDRRVHGLTGAVALGRGQVANVNLGMQDLAEDAQQRAMRQAAFRTQQKAFAVNTAMSAIGLGAAAYAGAAGGPSQQANQQQTATPASQGYGFNGAGNPIPNSAPVGGVYSHF